MTGVGGRPELIIEGSHNRDKGWKPYEFLYKPGSVDRRPPIVGKTVFLLTYLSANTVKF